jgi:hypothetical protein
MPWLIVIPAIAVALMFFVAIWAAGRRDDHVGELRRTNGESEGGLHYTKQTPL